jgi:hypothetical protein
MMLALLLAYGDADVAYHFIQLPDMGTCDVAC